MARSTVWDLAIVGAGPAGTAAALRALQVHPAARVLLLDRADFPRDKPCGDGIAPHVTDLLDGLGAAGAVDGHPPTSLLTLRSPGGVQVVATMRRSAYVVPRSVFDARLVRAATDRGAVLERRTVRDIAVERAPGGPLVRLGQDVVARAVIAADGANSALRRAAGLTRATGARTALAIRGYSAAESGQGQVIAASRERWPAYAWSFPTGRGSANVGYGEVLRGHPLTRGHLLERMHWLLPHLGGVGDLRAHLLPLAPWRVTHPSGPVLFAGDALGLANAFTGEGICYAVLSGCLAGQAAITGTAGTAGADAGLAYRRALARVHGRHAAHAGAAARVARLPALVDAAVTASSADRRVFDDMVELALGNGTLTARTLLGAARTVIRSR